MVNGNCMCINFYNQNKTGCINKIPNGYYNDDIDARTIKKCPEKCGTCSYESIITYNNLCVTCNIDEEYYPKLDDSNNKETFIECYKGEQESFYLDTNFEITDISTHININKTELINKKIENMINEFNLLNIENGYNVEVKEENILIELTSTKNEKHNENNNKVTIDIGQCENILKNIYNISDNYSLYIIKIIAEEEGMKIPKVEYEIYYPLYNQSLVKLNLDSCKETKVGISIPVTISDDINKYNPKSQYYNDICSKAKSECGSDITLNDRKNEFINNNMSLCEENCDLINYNYETKKVKCSCDMKIKIPILDDIKFDKNAFLESFIDINNIINIRILKCFKAVFNNSLKDNYGFFILLIIILLFLLCIIIFSIKSYNNLKVDINEIVIALKSK